MAIDLLIGRGYRPVIPGYDPNAPQIGVPYDPGQTNRVVRGQSPGVLPPVPVEHQPAPGRTPADYGPPPEMAPAVPTPDGPAPEEGPMVPWTAPGQVEGPNQGTGENAPMSTGPAKPNWMQMLGNLGPARGIPMAGPAASQRYSSTRPEFIYTNPVAAAQAARNFDARLGFESAQDQGYRDYLSRIAQTKSATEQFQAQAESNRQLQQAQLEAGRLEGEAARASNERVAGLQLATKQYQMEDAAWQANERAADRGEQIAGMLNANPNAKVDKKWAYLNPNTNKWESAFKRKPRPMPQTFGLSPSTPQIVAAPTPAIPTETAPAPAPAAPTPESPGMIGRILGAIGKGTTPAMWPSLFMGQ